MRPSKINAMKRSDLPRRRLLQGAGAVAAGLALAPSGARAAVKPNIVFILADDLGVADVGPYGVRDIRTPAIDRLAREGLSFERAYANSAVCSATRTALITGRYQDRLRCGLEEPIAGSSQNIGLPPDHPTLPSLLRRQGYATALVGKWHLGPPPAFGPLKSGYDHFFGFTGGAADYFTHQSARGVDQFWDDATISHQPGYLTDLFGDRAVRLIDGWAGQGRPFFLSLHFNAPHWPWEGLHDEAESKRLTAAANYNKALFDYDAGSRKIYAEMVERMDDQIGRVLDALDRGGLARDTIVIFTSDNGGERFSDTWPFSGMKGELLEGGLRVPAVLRWPASVAAGARTAQTAISMDWLPTLLKVAGGAPDPAYPTDGIDLTPTLADPALDVPRRLSWRYKREQQRAHVEGRWKYLRLNGHEFLFDVIADPRERANLKDREPLVFARLSKAWTDWNRTMLPEVATSYSWGPDGVHIPDRYGVADDLD
jgi:arylsulfatase A-like enzyme